MAERRRDGPYIWVTWLTKLLAGENSCEWGSWFRAQHEGWSWSKVPNGFDQVTWQLARTLGINENRRQWEAVGSRSSLRTEFLRAAGPHGYLGGKPDLIARLGDWGTIIDVKTGKPSPSHGVQLMLYMYAVPRAMRQYRGVSFDGRIAYQDHCVDIPAQAVDETFIKNVAGLMGRLSAADPARRVPSPRECRFCDISSLDCPERAADNVVAEGVTEDF